MIGPLVVPQAIQIVQIIDHNSIAVLKAVFGGISLTIDPINGRTVSQMKASDAIEVLVVG